MRRWGSWPAIALVLAVAMFVGVREDRAPRTENDRVTAIAAEVRCPTCESLSAAESDASAAQAVRDEIRTRLRDGQTKGQILGYLAGRYGDDILLRPEATGVAGLVWVLPVAGFLLAVGGLATVVRRRRLADGAAAGPSSDDRDLVEEALGS
ncbi:MAG TPA: cytochrome c-type biogenesis protein CcmH [Acidimicrobiales bacterium]|nr:cytochrome c-type biogenesis protein CcmH [Acidimicrobiales bacterium]